MLQSSLKISKWITAALVIFSSFSALAAQKTLSQQETAAYYTGKTVNGLGTVGHFLKMMAPHTTAVQMTTIKRLLSSKGIDEKTKFPILKVEGNKVYFDKDNALIYIDKNTILLNNVKFSMDGSSMDVVLNRIYKTMNEKSASFSLLPKANAALFDNMGGSLLGLLSAGAIGGIVGSAFGHPILGALAGVGLLYAGTWLTESVRNGEVTCEGGANGVGGLYTVRNRKAGPLLLGTNEKQPVDQSLLSNVFGGNIPPCDPNTAKFVRGALRSGGTDQQYNPYTISPTNRIDAPVSETVPAQ